MVGNRIQESDGIKVNTIGSSANFVYSLGGWEKLSKELKDLANNTFKLNVSFPRWGCMESIYWNFIDRIKE